MSDFITVPLQYREIPRSATKASIPAIGYGSGTKHQILKKSRPAEIRHTLHDDLVSDFYNAFKRGFRHIDTAEVYTTHEEVGEALKRVLDESEGKLKREDFFVTDKYSPGFEYKEHNITVPAATSGPYESINVALKELGLEYIDLYLIHSQFFQDRLTHGLSIEDAWLQIEKAFEEGKVRHIGVSNFDTAHLDRIRKVGKYGPQVLQIEYHAYLQNQSNGIIQYAKDHDILVEAYSPLAPLSRSPDGPLKDLLPELVAKYGKTDAQILLRWVYQQGIVVLTTTSNQDRLDDSLAIFGFELDQEDVEKIREVGASFNFRGFFGGFDQED
ncbi:hypothetical protein WICPIJ_001449 [Wickerhamomyces pijperi]|uniref:NADP-dependent oxidoreductase domain-containing protein n=1 Tax=Wickerhamomyces pijperi TaxID=599730 RepID=A0A9P8QDL4_WICPI|nr:hypothetical protein WICPIJ_001449 [Wickerhamomyces pijperi]